MDMGFVVFLLQTLLLISHYADGTALCRPVAVGESLKLTCKGNLKENMWAVYWDVDNPGGSYRLVSPLCSIQYQDCVGSILGKSGVISVKTASVFSSKLQLRKIDVTHKNSTISCRIEDSNSNSLNVLDACTVDIFHRPNYTSCQSYPPPNDGLLLSCEVKFVEHIFATNLFCNISFFLKTGKAVMFIPREEIVYSMTNISEGQSMSLSPNVNFRCQTSYIPLLPGTYSYRAQVFLLESFGSQRLISDLHEFTDLITIPPPTINLMLSAITCSDKWTDIMVSCTAKWQPTPPRFRWYVGDSLVQMVSKSNILTDDSSYPGLDTYATNTTISIRSSLGNEREGQITCEAISSSGKIRKIISLFDTSISITKSTSDSPIFGEKHGLVVSGAVNIQERENAQLLCQVTSGNRSITHVSVQCWNQLKNTEIMVINVTSAHDYIKSLVSFFIYGTADFNNSICNCVAYHKRPCFTTIRSGFRVHVSPRILQLDHESQQLHNKSQQIQNESQQLHNESQQLHNENQQPHNESQQLHNESQRPHNVSQQPQNENQQHTHKNIIIYTLPAALIAVFITVLCVAGFPCFKRRKMLTCLRDDPYQPTSHVYESVEQESRHCEEPPPLPIRPESRATETDPQFDDPYQTTSHTCESIEVDSRVCEQSPGLSIARESMAREGGLQFDGSQSTWPGTSGAEQNTCYFHSSSTGARVQLVLQEYFKLESTESESVQDPCYSSVTVYN